MDSLPFVSLGIFTAYLLFILIRYKKLKSISASYYRMPKKARPLFTFIIWAFTIPIVIYAEHGLLFYGAAFVGFVGAAPAFRKEEEKWVHYVGATLGIVLASIYIMFFVVSVNLRIIFILSYMLITIIIALKFERQKILIIEIIAFYIIDIGLIIQILTN